MADDSTLRILQVSRELNWKCLKFGFKVENAS